VKTQSHPRPRRRFSRTNSFIARWLPAIEEASEGVTTKSFKGKTRETTQQAALSKNELLPWYQTNKS